VKNIAGLGKRILGGVIDMIVMVVFMFVYIRLLGIKTDHQVYELQSGLMWLMYLIMLFYFAILEAITGKTFGKYIVKTKVVNKNNQLISWLQSLVRNVMRIIDGFAFCIVAVVALIFSSKQQRLGDMLAKTYVVND